MKKRYSPAILISVVAILASWQQGHEVVAKSEAVLSSERREAMPNLQGEPAVKYLKQRGLFESVRAKVEADRLEIKWHSRIDRVPGWKAINTGQNLEATFSREGTMIEPSQSCAGTSWQVAVDVSGVGYGERLSKLVSGPVRANGDRIEIQKLVSATDRQSAITEWYVNRPEGIEHGFTLVERPGASFGVEPLRVALSVSGDLKASIENDGQAVALAYQNGRQALRYDHLVAYDASGRVLPSRMKASGSEISILVDDTSAVYPVTIDPLFTEIKKLTASDGGANDEFGTSVSISGDTAIVGAPGDNSAYVFERNKGGVDLWGEVRKLTASDAGAASFGGSVSISTDTVIVGAPSTNGFEGSAFIFERNKGGADLWGEVKKLTMAGPVNGDSFGWSVAISGDTAIVGAFGDDVAKGSALVFDRNLGGVDNWGEVKKLTAADGTTGDAFGISVALSGDTAVVGAYADQGYKGSAYVFARNQGGADFWGEVKKLTAAGGAVGDEFGGSVAIAGDTAIVGAPVGNSSKGEAYVFERNKGGADFWGEVKNLTASDGAANDRFGVSVAIIGDTAIVGADRDGIAVGSAYAFERNKGGADLWEEAQKLTASDGAPADSFGLSVAISADTAIVGALGGAAKIGASYVFATDCEWAEKRKRVASDGFVGDQFGFAVAISGDTGIVGAPGDDSYQGSAYVFERNKGGAELWGEVRKLTASDGAANDQFGLSVGISGDTVIVGAAFDDGVKGSAYVFERNKGGADLWGEVKKLTSSDGVTNAEFGLAVSISGDTAIVGSPLDGAFRGSAYIYARNMGGADFWGEVRKVTASDGVFNDRFGSAVSISGDTAIIGAFLDDGKGSAYIYERNDGGADLWGEVKKVSASDGVAGDGFGISVSISGDLAIAGADGSGLGTGAAYVFERNKGGAGLWGEVRKLTASDGTALDNFGFSVGISGDTAIVGAPGDAGFTGAVYVFERNEGGADFWGEVRKIAASDGGALDALGHSVAISDDTAIVGANYQTIKKGSAYVLVCETEVLPNTPPTITGATISRTQGATGPVSDIATVGDSEDEAGSLTVTVLSAPPGITITGITNTLGTITANVAAACSATPGDNIVGLQVEDSGVLAATANLIVNVVEITLPPLAGGTAGTAYSQSAGASPPGSYTYSVSSGSLPGGLSLNPTTGLLSGTPNVAGTFNFSISAVGGGCTVSRSYSLLITCPTITLSALPAGSVNTPYSQTITGAPAGTTYSFALTSGVLPPGLTLSPAGVLSGSPEQSGVFNFSVTATGFGSCTGVLAYTITIGCPAMTVNPPSLPNGAVGALYAEYVIASPAGSYTFGVTAGTLPPGLTLDPGTGALTGAPTLSGTFPFTITAMSGGCSVLKAYSLVIGCGGIALSSLPGGTLNAPYSQTITASPAGPTYSFALTSGALPPGLTLSPTGTLTGTPTQGGTFTFTVAATDPGNCIGFRNYLLIVGCPVITVNPASLPGGTLGTAYSQSVSATPAGTYTFSVSNGILPLGLSLNAATGAITGTPTTVGTSIFTIRAAAGICLGTRTYTIVVTCPIISITPTSLAAGTSGTAYSQALSVSPAGSYTFSLVQGNLPPGTTLNTSTGLINGIAMVPGTYSFTVKAQLPNGCSTTQALSITINCPTVTVNPATLPGGQIGTPYSQMLSVVPAASYSFSVAAGALPPGLALNPVTGLLSGTPMANGPFNFTVAATGPAGCAGNRAYTVTIGPLGCTPITLPALPNGKVGTLYLKYVTPSPAGVYVYSLTGTLPPGLTLYGATGMVFGYPTSAGGYNFSITATNVNSCTGSSAYSVTIAP